MWEDLLVSIILFFGGINKNQFQHLPLYLNATTTYLAVHLMKKNHKSLQYYQTSILHFLSIVNHGLLTQFFLHFKAHKLHALFRFVYVTHLSNHKGLPQSFLHTFHITPPDVCCHLLFRTPHYFYDYYSYEFPLIPTFLLFSIFR